MSPVTLSPINAYQELVATKKITLDNNQQKAVELLDQLHLACTEQTSWFKKKQFTLKGVYLWGKVGRGKTFLMDLFANSLPDHLYQRQHFHHFMQDVYRQLKAYQGKPDPLKHVAYQFHQQYRVLCFDEFFVSDIGDAMLLGNLLQHLFELGIAVVFTSNCAPDELYRNGLQRARFLPAIAAIKQYASIFHLDGEQDYRHRVLTSSPCYFVLPPKVEQQAELHQKLLKQVGLVQQQAENSAPNAHQITILHRHISCIAEGQFDKNKAIAFNFSDLCLGPRSHFDYVELARLFNTILLFDVPVLSGNAGETIKARGTEDNGSNINLAASETGQRQVVLAPMDDGARRFIALVDECYDRRIKLIITAVVPLNQLYSSGSLMFEFERTKSRLTEMASVEYNSTVNNPNKLNKS